MLRRSSPWLLGLILAARALNVHAGEPTSPGKVVSVDGALLARDGKKWQPIKVGDPIRAGVLIVGLPQGELVSANGAVGIKLMADIGQRGPFPVLESALSLNQAKKTDLDVTLDRGIAVFTNIKKSGSAKVHLRFRGEVWDLDLKEPGTKVGVEIFSRHVPHGDVFKEDDPTMHVAMLVVQGRVFVDSGKEGSAMSAPPGAAMMLWDSVARHAQLSDLQELPPSLKNRGEKEQKLLELACQSTAGFATGKIDGTLEGLLKSSEKHERLVGVTVLGALDRTEQLLGALSNPHHADMRDRSILVLRTWLGRSPGQIQKLNQTLTKGLGLTTVQAKNVLHLLIGLTEQERHEVGSLELLVSALNHPHLAIRELARWHLVRLAPAGKDIAFDAAAAEPERRQAMAAWHKIIEDIKAKGQQP